VRKFKIVVRERAHTGEAKRPLVFSSVSLPGFAARAIGRTPDLTRVRPCALFNHSVAFADLDLY
jgi:hypothetical protein